MDVTRCVGQVKVSGSLRTGAPTSENVIMPEDVHHTTRWVDGRPHIRLLIPFYLGDAGKVIAEDGKIRDYSVAPNEGGYRWEEVKPNFFIPSSTLIDRFRRAIEREVDRRAGYTYDDSTRMTVRFHQVDGAPWGQDSVPVEIRPSDVFKDKRWVLIDRAMRIQRFASRRDGIPCPYETLSRISVSFEMAAPF